MARLTPDNQRRAQDLIALYPYSRSALIPILHVLQEQDGYLSEDGMEHVGQLLGLTGAEVRGTATFYDMFHLEPVGRYVIAVCTNIACMLQGAYRLIEHAEERLGVAAGETTRDGMFTVEDAECLALCGNSPCVTVNWRFFGDVDLERFDTLIDDLRAGRLADEVPPHGTLSRVRRNVGLLVAPPEGDVVAEEARAAVGSGAAGTGAAGSGAAASGAISTAGTTVDLDTHRTTPAVASLVDGHPGTSGGGG